MGKPSTSSSAVAVSEEMERHLAGIKVSEDMPREHAYLVLGFFKSVGISDPEIDKYNTKDFYSDLLCAHLKIQTIQRGHLTCLASVKPAVGNYFGSLHGGALGAMAERMSIATARTVVDKDKELFLGELSMSYLSAAPLNAQLIVDGSVVRSGRSLTVVSVEFRAKDTGKLIYTSRATLFHGAISNL